MGIPNSDNRFDFAKELLFVNANLTNDECISAIKSSLKTFKGADEDFVKDICSRNSSTFKISYSYYPVYATRYLVTYRYTLEKTQNSNGYEINTTTKKTKTQSFDKDFFIGPEELQLNNFVGRQDERFYILPHVADLNAPIANSISENELDNSIRRDAERHKPVSDASFTINGWEATVVFVPIAFVEFEYNNKQYRCCVNSHNGFCKCSYLISKEAEEAAFKSRKKSITMRTISAILCVIASAISILFSVINNFDVESLIITAPVIIFTIICLFKIGGLGHTIEYFKEIYGKEGVTASTYTTEVVLLILSIISFILPTINLLNTLFS